MRRLTRYAISVVVGLAVTVPVLLVGYDSPTILLAIPLVYATTTAIAHWDALPTSLFGSRESRAGWKMGAIAGGVSAFVCIGLLQVSIPAGIAGYGLLLFGSVLTTAELDVTDES
ncbi:hypothetical protein [Natronobacterium texcoconense]|uniref:DUF8153 domain-containing protein n=1 Tax=Natronobacterium texcoconense TaxID=1095778 RepID=A0A1H1IDU3_NATTX|nr:hypothetical protein [Natronobacterium texcoconense]SDR35812.1 hypothetical protein SAMN04489842_3467 [Natronobacterium texcoconense]